MKCLKRKKSIRKIIIAMALVMISGLSGCYKADSSEKKQHQDLTSDTMTIASEKQMSYNLNLFVEKDGKWLPVGFKIPSSEEGSIHVKLVITSQCVGYGTTDDVPVRIWLLQDGEVSAFEIEGMEKGSSCILQTRNYIANEYDLRFTPKDDLSCATVIAMLYPDYVPEGMMDIMHGMIEYRMCRDEKGEISCQELLTAASEEYCDFPENMEDLSDIEYGLSSKKNIALQGYLSEDVSFISEGDEIYLVGYDKNAVSSRALFLICDGELMPIFDGYYALGADFEAGQRILYHPIPAETFSVGKHVLQVLAVPLTDRADGEHLITSSRMVLERTR